MEAELLFDERHFKDHPLWEIMDVDASEIFEEGEHPIYPKSWIDRNRDRMPEWVHAVPYEGEGNPGARIGTPRFTLEIVKRLRGHDCDLIHAWTLIGAIWASFSGKPYVYHVTGRLDWKLWDTIFDNPLKRIASKRLASRAIKKADAVIAGPRTAKELKSAYQVEPKSLRHPIDTEFFSPGDTDGSLKEHYGCEMLFFAGARHEWDLKKNNYIFEALASAELPDYHLVTVDQGSDLERSRELVSELGLEEQVSFVPLMSRPRLIRMINSCDAVLDQFETGLGTLGTQTLSCGTPLISAFDEDYWMNDRLKSAPPVLRANSAEEIARHLDDISDREFRAKASEMSRLWMEENYAWEDAIEDFVELYNKFEFNNTFKKMRRRA